MLRSTVPLLDVSLFSNLTGINFGTLSSKIKNKNDMSPESSVMKGGHMHRVFAVFPSPFSVEQSLLCSI